MLLALDIGNTFIKYGIYERNNLLRFTRVKHNRFNSINFNEFKISEVAVSSVVPKVEEEISKSVLERFNISPYHIDKNNTLGITLNYSSVTTLGIDRICAAVGAFYSSDNSSNIIYADLGTATTINYVIDGAFEGGLILPGLETMINSLNLNTAQLPKVDLSQYNNFIGKDTPDCIISGIINSTICVIEKSVSQLNTRTKLIITGGNAKFIEPHLDLEYEFIEDLVLRGVKKIFELNN
ncbi:MAG: type III pantothenate kinase [Melioribacteraceae bacterium]|nr:type III pantothenate kinase [Melioribacteraceae bacterium]